MTYLFSRERYADAIEDVKPLLMAHWRELALFQNDIPLDPDFEVYQALDKAGALAAYMIRQETDRRLVGYGVYFLRKHHHYRQHMWAVSDIILVERSHRNAGVGNGLFDFMEPDLKAQGVAVMHTMTKVMHPELAALLQMRGHDKVEVSYAKRL